jgi:hypothetical protein
MCLIGEQGINLMVDEIDWHALAKRCELAADADRKIDFGIFKALNPEFSSSEWEDSDGVLRHRYNSDDMKDAPLWYQTPEFYTYSSNVMLALIERELKDWIVYRIEQDVERRWFVELRKSINNGDYHCFKCAMSNRNTKSLSLGLCAAFCRAMIHQTTNFEDRKHTAPA